MPKSKASPSKAATSRSSKGGASKGRRVSKSRSPTKSATTRSSPSRASPSRASPSRASPSRSRSGSPKKATSSKRRSSVKKRMAGTSEKKAVRHIVMCDDPWAKYKSPFGGKLSPADEWNRLNDTPLRWIAATSEDVAGIHEDYNRGYSRLKLYRELQQEPEKTVSLPKIEDEMTTPQTSSSNGGAGVTLQADSLEIKNSDIGAFVFTDEMRKHLIALNLSGNLLTANSIDQASLSCSWLRDINFTGNRFNDFPLFVRPTRLLRLNMSYNKPVPYMNINFGAHMKQLRELNLEGCMLKSLGAKAGSAASSEAAQEAVAVNVLTRLTCLQNLNIALNALSLDELKKVLQLRSLRRLALHHNPGCDDPQYQEDLVSMLPKKLPSLKFVDGHQTKLVGGKVMVGGELGGDGFSSGILAEDSASCSCLEGNPCVVPYNCKDWKNRFEVARMHR